MGVPGDLPLLPANVSIPHPAFTVDNQEAWPLTQRDGPALHLVKVVDGMLWVRQARKGDIMLHEVASCGIQGVVDYSQDFSPRIQEPLVMLRQPAKLPSAEGSQETPQEHQNYTTLSSIVSNGDLSTPCGWQCEVRRQ